MSDVREVRAVATLALVHFAEHVLGGGSGTPQVPSPAPAQRYDTQRAY